MKFKINIANKEVLLTSEQLSVIVDTLHGIDTLTSEYVGSGKGDNGTNYIRLIRQLDVSDISVSPLADEYVDTVRLRTKMHDDNK